jgi:hypothetical protein
MNEDDVIKDTPKSKLLASPPLSVTCLKVCRDGSFRRQFRPADEVLLDQHYCAASSGKIIWRTSFVDNTPATVQEIGTN